MTEEADIKVVSMKEWCRNDSLVSMLEIMLEAAREGSLIGAAGTFLLLGDDNDPPQLGVMKTDNMGGNVFTVVGALEKIKLQLLDEIESE
jgi:hypothetical protein